MHQFGVCGVFTGGTFAKQLRTLFDNGSIGIVLMLLLLFFFIGGWCVRGVEVFPNNKVFYPLPNGSMDDIGFDLCFHL